MAELKLYLDEDIPKALTAVLKSRGFNVVRACEVGMNGKSDEEQLAYAVSQGRAILSFNARHYASLAKSLYENQQEHFGIIVSQKTSLSELVRWILSLMSQLKLRI